MHVEMGQMAAS